MSEQNIIAPGPKVKDPRRVAAGKRLAAISKQAKEKKALRLKQEAEMNSAKEETGDGYAIYFVGGLVVVGTVSYLLLTNKEKVIRTFSADKKESEPEPTPKREQSPPKKANFKSVFDD